MDGELAHLIREHALPPGCSAPRLFADTIEVAGVPVRRAGIACTTPSGAELTGSAAELEGSPVARAYYELLERIAIVEAARGEPPAEGPCRPARSNGVALHRTWAEACRRASLELIERDRVLRSWFGELAPASCEAPALLAAIDTHEWRACSLPDEASAIEVAVVIGFPRRPELPLARGFAASERLEDALDAAGREALQTLAFLWDEPVPDAPPAPAPTPMFHLDYYLYPPHHALLARWLDGEHARSTHEVRERAEPRFVDLTPAWLAGSLFVARAVEGGARALVFGESECRPPGLPGSHVHPIP